ncbi:MAG: DUF3179 domain-containing protein [Gammaproteobacteria bacterium]|nr:MAG: DUF3179 domain-containing protein [Gammaproteobacteria bacterium]
MGITAYLRNSLALIFKLVIICVLVAFLTNLYCPTCFARDGIKNGFDLTNATINKDEILFGGPPRDGIPAINSPNFLTIEKIDYLRDKDIVLSVKSGDVVRAYPTRILVWHEIVNDVVAGKPVVVTYCPLCGTGMVFDRMVDGRLRTFGVSGLLYQSDVLMYDRETESLWSQLAMKGVSGDGVDVKLKWLPSEHLTWKAWKEKYPHGEVLSMDTGFSRNYGARAYASYFDSDVIMFPVPQTRKELANKEKVLGVIINGKPKAYPLSGFKVGQVVKDDLGGVKISVSYDGDRQYPLVTDAKGQDITSVVVFWFAWQAFYPNTELWSG